MNRTIQMSAMILFVALGSVFTPRLARADDVDWVRLGEARAGRDPDRDQFDIDTPDTSYAKIRFRVHGPAVHFMHVEVVFGDGDKEEIDMDKNVANDEGTGPLSLHGKHRKIKQVNVLYQTIGHHRGGDGVVTLWGLRD